MTGEVAGPDAALRHLVERSTRHDPDAWEALYLPPSIALYPVVEVTAEPGDGNPLPTGPIVLRTTIRS